MMKPAVIMMNLVLLAVCASTSEAQDTAAFRAWLENETKVTPDAGIPANVVISYEILTPSRLTPDELAKLRTEVAGKPDHTKLPLLEDELRRQAAGPDRSHIQVWWAESGYWRRNSDSLGALSAMKYNDTAVTPNVSWRMVPEQLTVVDSTQGAPRGYDLAGTEPGIRSQVGNLMRGGLPTAAQSGRTVQRAELQGERWTATIGDDKLVYEFEGRWSQEHARGFVESSRIVQSSNPQFLGWKTTCEEWERFDAVDTWVSRRVVRRFADGTIDTELRLLEVRPSEKGEIERVTRLPAHDSTDPTRGPVSFGRVYDFRPDINKATYPGDPNRDPVPLAAGSSSMRFQIIGWSTAVVIVLMLIVLRLRRERRVADTVPPNIQGGTHAS